MRNSERICRLHPSGLPVDDDVAIGDAEAGVAGAQPTVIQPFTSSGGDTDEVLLGRMKPVLNRATEGADCSGAAAPAQITPTSSVIE
jgi:hypothetical protein